MPYKINPDTENRSRIVAYRNFRAAADLVVQAWSCFPEIAAIAITGSVAKPLRMELPRAGVFRRRGIELWHACNDLDLVVWLDATDRLGALRRARDKALTSASANGSHVANHQIDVFLFEATAGHHYLGRLCNFGKCPKGKPECWIPGCGAISFSRVIPGFTVEPSLLASTRLLYRRGEGIVARAVDLPAEDRRPGPAKAKDQTMLPTASPPAFTIRPVRAGDLQAIIEVDTRITATPKPEYWHGKFAKFGADDKEGFFLVASQDEVLRGFIVGEIRAWEFGSPLCGWVSAIGVNPDSRLAGIGSALFDDLCARFREAGVTRIRTMLARDAQLVMSFFRSQGMMAGPFIQLEKELDD